MPRETVVEVPVFGSLTVMVFVAHIVKAVYSVPQSTAFASRVGHVRTSPITPSSTSRAMRGFGARSFASRFSSMWCVAVIGTRLASTLGPRTSGISRPSALNSRNSAANRVSTFVSCEISRSLASVRGKIARQRISFGFCARRACSRTVRSAAVRPVTLPRKSKGMG